MHGNFDTFETAVTHVLESVACQIITAVDWGLFTHSRARTEFQYIDGNFARTAEIALIIRWPNSLFGEIRSIT